MNNVLNYKDGYKTDHRRQYPIGTEKVYSNFTPRESRIPGVNKIVVFGLQYFVKEYLVNRFNTMFFSQPKDVVVASYKRRLDTYLGKDSVPVEHIEKLHDLGYLPLHIKAMAEGSLCPLRVPCMTITNTHPDFFWLTNDVETILSNTVWMPMTSATIAYQYKKILTDYAKKTSDMPDFVQFQGHDFSMRGHSSLESACTSGAGHLLSFVGTDTIPAIDFLEKYYGANAENELVGCSVPATEHSVMCLGGNETELHTFKRLITELYPNGIVSIVSDTWDYWGVLTVLAPSLKNEILSRNGKVVFRPDSGDPVKIVCGDKDATPGSPEHMGSIEVLWNIFGGTINSKGYKQLNPNVGLIYGDSITIERCRAICEGLEAKGFASTNIVFGIGSYTYQYVTRDTFGFAVKATYGVVNGESKEIWKNPKTDNGMKRSAKGLLCVDADFNLQECVSEDIESTGILQTIFKDGKIYHEQSLAEIRNKLNSLV